LFNTHRLLKLNPFIQKNKTLPYRRWQVFFGLQHPQPAQSNAAKATALYNYGEQHMRGLFGV
jgi:hypothetical protein